MCKYCKYNKLDRASFHKLLWQEDNDITYILDSANIGTYINNDSLVSIYCDDGESIEQDEIKITCCPACGESFK